MLCQTAEYLHVPILFSQFLAAERYSDRQWSHIFADDVITIPYRGFKLPQSAETRSSRLRIWARCHIWSIRLFFSVKRLTTQWQLITMKMTITMTLTDSGVVVVAMQRWRWWLWGFDRADKHNNIAECVWFHVAPTRDHRRVWLLTDS